MPVPVTMSEAVEMHRLAGAGLSPVVIADRVGRAPSTVRRALTVSPSERSVRRPGAVPPPPQISHAPRQARARVRSDLVTGRLLLADVLVPVDPVVADMMLADVVRMQWSTIGRRAVPTLEQLGKLALRDRVNLMMAAGRASGYSRAWVAEHGSKWARPRAVAS